MISLSAIALQDNGEVRRRGWLTAIVALGVALLGILLIYHNAVLGAWHVWTGSAAYNHCFLVIPIALYMGWTRRTWLAGRFPQPNWFALALVALMSLAWLAGAVLGILEIRQFAVLTLIQAVLLATLGWPLYRLLLAPFLYLYFLVPTGEFLIPSLQSFTAQFATHGLQLVGIPVYTDGTIIQIPAGTFAVAEACAGLRFLVAAIAFGVFYACQVYTSLGRRFVFAGVSLVLPVIANGFRAFGLIAAAQLFGSAAAIEADHIIYGWLFFSLVLVVLIYVGHLFAQRDPLAAFPAKESSAMPDPVSPKIARQVVSIAVLGLILAAIGPLLGAGLQARSRTLLPAAALPLPAGWQPVAGSSDWKPKIFQADRTFADTVERGGERLDRFIALYVPHGLSTNLLHSENRVADPDMWRTVSRQTRTVDIEGKKIAVQVTQVATADRRRIIWSFYALDNAVATTVWQVKWHEGTSFLDGKRCASAFVAISEEFSGQNASPRALEDYFAGLRLPRAYFCRRMSKS
ncbi:MAG: exosortase A [Rhizomicrobium sp.]